MSRLTAPLRRIASRLGSLPTDTSGLAYIEFAYMLPILMALGLGGIELANLSLTHTRVSQIALSLADNSSRAKQDVVTGLPRLRETDINQILTASQLQGGDLDMTENGRLILSSLEVNAEDGQWIHWQRCIGDKDHDSTYGVQGDGTTGTGFPGMGPASRRIVAEDGLCGDVR